MHFRRIVRPFQRIKYREVAVDGLFIAGIALVAVGLGMIYLPLAPIIGGLAVVGIAMVLR